MKFLMVIACLLVLGASVRADLRDTYLTFMSDHMKMCANELGISQSDLDQLRTVPVLTEPKTQGCLAICVFKKFNLIQDGVISIENVRNLVDTISGDTPDIAEKIKATAIECINTSAGKFTDECELGMHTLNCGIAALKV